MPLARQSSLSLLASSKFDTVKCTVVHLTYRWHSSLSLEASPDPIVDTLWLAPVCVNAFVGVALVTIEALRAWMVVSKRPLLVPTIPLFDFMARRLV